MSLFSAVRNGNLDAITRIFTLAAAPDSSISVDANERDFHGCTPLMEASSRGSFRIVKLLKSKGARINVKDKRGNTALMFAAERGNLQVVKFLVEGGAKIDMTDNNGNTAFLLACAKGHKDVALYLKEKGTMLKVASCIGISAIDHAYRHGFGKDIDEEPSKRLNPKELKPHKGPTFPRMNGRRPATAAVFSGTSESAATTRRETALPKDYLAEILLEKEKKEKKEKKNRKGERKTQQKEEKSRAQPKEATKQSKQNAPSRDAPTSNENDDEEEKRDYSCYPYFEKWLPPKPEEEEIDVHKVLSTSKLNYR